MLPKYILYLSPNVSGYLGTNFTNLNGRWVLKTTANMGYSDAQKFCQGYFAKHFIPVTEADYNYTTDMANSTNESLSPVVETSMWFPINDLEVEGEFRWTNGTSECCIINLNLL